MDVNLRNLRHHENDPLIIFVEISIGDSLPIEYQASLIDTGDRNQSSYVDTELFMQLSDLAHQRFGDCTIYQIELMWILNAFAASDLDLELPARLGTTDYCLRKPTRWRVLLNKLSFWCLRMKLSLGIGSRNFGKPNV
ncbi:MAG: hypothetical protein ACI814_001232 [Mariniblastus sp.]|jgi:hypothetical protein